jgi:hypothetical protein
MRLRVPNNSVSTGNITGVKQERRQSLQYLVGTLDIIKQDSSQPVSYLQALHGTLIAKRSSKVRGRQTEASEWSYCQFGAQKLKYAISCLLVGRSGQLRLCTIRELEFAVNASHLNISSYKFMQVYVSDMCV